MHSVILSQWRECRMGWHDMTWDLWW